MTAAEFASSRTEERAATGSTDLVKSVSIDNLVNQRCAVVDKMTRGLALLREAAELASAAHLGFPAIGLNTRGGRDFEHRLTGSLYGEPGDRLPEVTAAAVKAIDATAWAYLMNESGLRTFMDATARSEWAAKLRELDVPPLTVDNVTATFTALHASRGELFERGVIACFRALSWDFKTNQPFKFGNRVILRHLLTAYGSGRHRWLSASTGTVNRLDDLDRVFHILDDKPEPDHRRGWHTRIASGSKAGEAPGAYFSVRWFLNGNGHLSFTRPDLVDRMNCILAKHHPNALASEVR